MKISWRKEKILVTGGSGMVGQNLVSRLRRMGLDVWSAGNSRSAAVAFDLRDQSQTKKLFDWVDPSVVFHLAARVGGIYANYTQKAEFYLENTQINTNVMAEVQKRETLFVFAMGTGCAYPKRLEGSILAEESFLDGIPESTNDAYAYSKRNLLVHLQALEERGLNYCYCIPANLYGPYDNFHPLHSHVVPGLIGKFVKAKKENEPFVKVWGGGEASRDFLFIEDLIDAMILICDNLQENRSVNVATGVSVKIKDLAFEIQKIVGYKGEILFCDNDGPEGQNLRLFDVKKIYSLGWGPRYSLTQGLQKTIDWYMKGGSE